MGLSAKATAIDKSDSSKFAKSNFHLLQALVQEGLDFGLPKVTTAVRVKVAIEELDLLGYLILLEAEKEKTSFVSHH